MHDTLSPDACKRGTLFPPLPPRELPRTILRREFTVVRHRSVLVSSVLSLLTPPPPPSPPVALNAIFRAIFRDFSDTWKRSRPRRARVLAWVLGTSQLDLAGEFLHFE